MIYKEIVLKILKQRPIFQSFSPKFSTWENLIYKCLIHLVTYFIFLFIYLLYLYFFFSNFFFFNLGEILIGLASWKRSDRGCVGLLSTKISTVIFQHLWVVMGSFVELFWYFPHIAYLRFIFKRDGYSFVQFIRRRSHTGVTVSCNRLSCWYRSSRRWSHWTTMEYR